ncbi:FecCD family ABC transporter permease [Demequina litorisediminis]|uniref:ABC transporter permease n=1 Tax=Demequina litorisediminis TaxID=1849022 RepID=A0ABQ6IG86_9MICO|nr:iron ABC transporter permease [Demequina litorisediminis]GMA36800.1 ABC transporter permease [Demequina litorisediminis]
MSAVISAPGSSVVVRRRSTRVRALWLVAAIVVLVGLACLSVAVGSRAVTWEEIGLGVTGHVDTIGQAAVYKRVPRTILAIVVGAALAVSGAVMQGVTRNPLADPGILGVTMGASLAVVTGIAWFGLFSVQGYIWTAIVGAGVTAVAVYAVGSLGRGGATPLKLALAGAATSAALTSLISAVVLPRGDIVEIVQSWQVGGVGGATYEPLATVAPFLVVGFVMSWGCSRWLNSMALGDEVAAGLGVKVAGARACAALGAVILAGAATAVAGPIAFVGLVVPHVCRLLVGVDHRWLIPFSAVVGACLVTTADVVGRLIAQPAEIQVGIVTAIVGAPVFIAIVRRTKVREL